MWPWQALGGGRRGFPVPSFSVWASGLPLIVPHIWLPSFGETAVGLAHAEKRKSEVCPWGGQ